ncbi:hypothetical protein LZ30DRAFT_688400 [Colletotrichum cereale]|nr:hypothetical protein LZ30DRAFT_688400 [Colletotrichum cereale]
MTFRRFRSATQTSLSGLVLTCAGHAYAAGATSAHAPSAQLPSKSEQPTFHRLHSIETAKSKSAEFEYNSQSPTRAAAYDPRPEEPRADDRLLDTRVLPDYHRVPISRRTTASTDARQLVLSSPP